MKIKNLKKNKKGLLPRETLKLVLSVISILFLVGFFVLLYYSSTRDKDLEFAEASLEHLISEINSGAKQVEIYNPTPTTGKYWILFIFPFGEDELRPLTCSNLGWEKCICICGMALGNKGNFHEKCDVQGVCKEFDNSFKISQDNPWFEDWRSTSPDDIIYFINLPITLEIDYELNTISKKEET